MFYCDMIKEDMKQDFENFKYIGMLTNPEGFKQIEDKLNPESKVDGSGYQPASGKDATRRIQEENQKYNITRYLENQDDFVEVE